MLRMTLYTGFLLIQISTVPVLASVLPEDCSGVNAQSEECGRLLSMASYVEQSKAQAASGKFSSAIDTIDKAIKIAKTFHPELYVEYIIDQAEYAEDWARDIRGVKGLQQALAILQRAIPSLGKVDNLTTKTRFYNRISSLYVELASINNDATYSEAAIESFQHILSLVDKDVDREYWANIQYNLGLAYSTHYENTDDTAYLILGKKTLQEALKYFEKSEKLKEWASVSSGLADNDAAAAIVFDRADLAQAALNRYNEVAQALKSTPYKEELANAYHNGALVSMRLGRETEDFNHLRAAHNYFGKAVDLYEDVRDYFSWVTAYSNQAWATFYGAQITQNPKHYLNAVKMVQNILDNFPQHKSPVRWAELVNQLGDLQMGAAAHQQDITGAQEAIQSFEVAAKVYEEIGDTEQYDLVQNKIYRIKVILIDLLQNQESGDQIPEDTDT